MSDRMGDLGFLLTLLLLTSASCGPLPDPTCVPGAELTQQDLSIANQYVTRDGDLLRVSTMEGELVLTDQCPELKAAECARYRLTAFAADRLFVFHLALWEGEAYLTIDRETGERIELHGFPYASPNGKHLVAASGSISDEAHYEPNTLALWSRSLHGFWEKRLTHHLPDNMAYCVSGWRDNDTVRLTGMVADPSSPSEPRFFPASLRWNGWYWQLHGEPPL